MAAHFRIPQLLLTLPVLGPAGFTAAAEAPPAPPVSLSAPATPVAALQTRAFDCGRVPILVVLLGDNATVYLPDRGLTLTRITDGHTATAQYVNESSRFSLEGHIASLKIGRKRYAACHEDAARAFWQAAQLRGSAFRATATDASWTLDLLEPLDSGVLRYAPADSSGALWFRNAQRETAGKVPAGTADRGNIETRYAAQSSEHRISISIVGQACNTDAIHTTFSARVELDIDGRSSSGCGGPVP
jgi:hypothetical protein